MQGTSLETGIVQHSSGTINCYLIRIPSRLFAFDGFSSGSGQTGFSGTSASFSAYLQPHGTGHAGQLQQRCYYCVQVGVSTGASGQGWRELGGGARILGTN